LDTLLGFIPGSFFVFEIWDAVLNVALGGVAEILFLWKGVFFV